MTWIQWFDNIEIANPFGLTKQTKMFYYSLRKNMENGFLLLQIMGFELKHCFKDLQDFVSTCPSQTLFSVNFINITTRIRFIFTIICFINKFVFCPTSSCLSYKSFGKS